MNLKEVFRAKDLVSRHVKLYLWIQRLVERNADRFSLQFVMLCVLEVKEVTG